MQKICFPQKEKNLIPKYVILSIILDGISLTDFKTDHEVFKNVDLYISKPWCQALSQTFPL